jgi:hypothetical protein
MPNPSASCDLHDSSIARLLFSHLCDSSSSLPLPHCAIPLPLPHHAVSHFRSNSSSPHCAIHLPLPVFPTARTVSRQSIPLPQLIPSAAADELGGNGSVPARRPDDGSAAAGRRLHRPSATHRPSVAARRCIVPASKHGGRTTAAA